MKKYESIENLVKAFINDNKEVVKLLTCSMEDKSYAELCEEEVIGLYTRSIKDPADEKEELFYANAVEGDLPCSLFVRGSEEVVRFEVVCRYSAEVIEGIGQRSLEILSRLYSYLGNDTNLGNYHLDYFSSARRIYINEDVQGYNLIYFLNEIDDENMDSNEYDDSQGMNYLTIYKDFWSVLSEAITSDKELLSLMGDNLEDVTMAELVKLGYVRLMSNFECNFGTDCTRFLIIQVEEKELNELIIDAVAVCDVDGENVNNGISRLEAIGKLLEKRLLGIAGASFWNRSKGEFRNFIRYNVEFKVKLSEETFAGVIDEKEIIRKYKASRRPNFFCDMTTMNALAAMNLDDKDYEYIDFTIDVIDETMMILYMYGETKSTVKVYLRGEVYSHDDSGYCIGTATFNHETGNVSVEDDSSVNESVMAMIVRACVHLNQYIQSNSLSESYHCLDIEEEGVLIVEQEGEFKCTIVAGKERPDLLCNKLFGDAHMYRPYSDEEYDDLMYELNEELKELDVKAEKEKKLH